MECRLCLLARLSSFPHSYRIKKQLQNVVFYDLSPFSLSLFMKTLWLGLPGTGQSHQGRGDIFRGLLIVSRHKDDLQF